MSDRRRSALDKLLRERRQQADAGREAATLPRRQGDGPAPLSFTQERLWFLDRLQPGGAVYNIPLVLHLEGDLDPALLGRALSLVAERQESLRTRIVTIEHEGKVRARQVVDPPAPVPLPVVDLGGFDAAALEPVVVALAMREAKRPIALEGGRLCRFTLLRAAAAEHYLLLTQHHAVSDGWSSGVLMRELTTVLRALVAGADDPLAELPPLPIQYADFATWQRQHLQGDELERLLGHWRRRLEGAPGLLELPTDRPRPALQSYRGAALAIRWSEQLSERVEERARQLSASPFMLLLAAFQAFLSRLSGQRDVVVGTPIANRGRVETEGLIGFFANTLALRVDLGDDPSFAALVERVRGDSLDDFAHQELPFEELVAALKVPRSLSHSPIFQVLFALQNAPRGLPRGERLQVQRMAVHGGAAKFDLSLGLTRLDDGFRGSFEYNVDLFDRATIERWAASLETMLAAALERPETPVSELPLLAGDERRRLLVDWNDTARDYDGPETLDRLVARQAAATPDAPALSFRGESLSFADFSTRVAALAVELRRRGVMAETTGKVGDRLNNLSPGQREGIGQTTGAATSMEGDRLFNLSPVPLVGVAMERSVELVVALHAVVAAGGAYVPVDPGYPEERVAFMIGDALGGRGEHRGGVLLTQEALRERMEALAPEGVEVLAVDTLELEPSGILAELPPSGAGAESAAYAIYTSGSTGQPKGAVNRHRAIVNRLLWMQEAFGIGAGDRVLQKTPFSFDVSVWELFWPFITGAELVVAEPGGHQDPGYLARTIRDRGITTLHFVPSMLQVFLDEPGVEECTSLVRVIASGEALPPALVRRFHQRLGGQGTRLFNLYGPTEAAIDVSWVPCDEADPERVTIGVPVANTRLHVVDRHMRPQPVGVAGELLIGGVQLARGYLGRPSLTAERFVPDPFADLFADRGDLAGDGRLYRTGDLARYLPSADGRPGEIEYLGRLDHQVKIRGLRIELGEIEVALSDHPAVREAVVMALGDGPADLRLVAFLVADEAEAAPAAVRESLREHLRTRLPEHMVPAAYVHLDEMPVSPNGKADRKELAKRAPRRGLGLEVGAASGAPAGDLERRVAAVWAKVLGHEAFSPQDNFFDVGGHSLLAVQLQRDLRRDLGFEVEVVDLFQYPTVRSLAGFLRQVSGEETAAAEVAPRAAAGGAVSGGSVAVVGMAGRFPGAASVDELWDNLRSGVESVRTYTDDEMRAFGVSEELLADPHFVPVGAELEGADLFDAGYFDYSPREADVIDPQQRVFLETAVAALEDAAVDPARYGGRIGVFAGAAENRHVFRIAAHPELVRSVGPYQVMLSNRADYLPTRTAYKLGLTGPAINVQTACSTSLVAVHVACRALLAGECEAALAGGVSVGYLEPRGYRWERGGISSPDGHTRAFDAAGRGTTRGHGVGVVVLKRLEDALADGDSIHGVIRGSATNNDGRLKAGFTAPSVDGQTAVIRAAQRAAGVEPSSVGYVEAHGTATELGDPIEFAALRRAFDGAGVETGAVALGSVKSNLGHLDAASGVTGLIKALLAVREGEIPPSLHFETPNPKLGLDESPFHVATGLEAWPAGDGPRRAGVSSFGVGGTNAHAIVEEPPAVEVGELGEPPGWVCLPLSARTPEALAATGERLAAWLEAHEDLDAAALADAAWTLQTGRRELEQRRTVVADGREAAIAALRTGGGLEARGEAAGMPSVAFLLSGQGTQHLGMARSLHAAFPAFHDAFERCRTLLAGHLDVDLAELVWGSEGGDREAEAARLEDTRHAQPALFAVEYAAAELWRAAGVVPSALLGHSLGEYVAACLAGVFSLDDALALVAARGRAMAACEPGSMLAVARSEAEVGRLLSGQTAVDVRPASVELAAVNGPEACVVSGPAPAVEAWAAEVAAAGVEVKPLHTSHAFHSAAMEPALDPLRQAFAGVETSPPRIPFLSNRTGSWITADQATDPEYWLSHLRAPVRFAAGAAELLADESRLLVEVGPGRALATLARQQPAARGRTVVQSLAHPRGGQPDEARFLAAAGALWCAGAAIDWRPFTGTGRRRLRLPSYPFQRQSHWVAEPRRAAGGGAAADVAEPSVRQRSAAAVAAAPPVGGGDGEGAPRTPLEAQLAAAWHELLGGDPIGADDDFFDLGGSSLLAVRLAARLGDRFGVDLDPHDLVDHSTVARLATRLEALHPRLAAGGETAEHAASAAPSTDSSTESSPDPLLVRLRGDGAGTPLFLVHPAGGHALYYRHVVAALAALKPGRPVWAFRASGLEAGEEVISGVEKMAERYLAALRRARPHGPYALAGSSFGGSVAWEMARRLSEAGETVEALVLVDTFGPGQLPERGAVQAPREADEATMPDTATADADAVDARIDAVTRANVESMYAYEPAPWEGRATFFRATLRSGPGEPTHPERAWVEVARGGLEVQLLPGGHISMHAPPHAAALAARFDDVLRRAISSPACPASAVGVH